MTDPDKFAIDLKNLEDLLVKQFRTLQNLIDLTKKERQRMLENDGGKVMQVVEEKEAVLDQLSLLEDARRKFVQSLALQVDLHSEQTSVAELLPFLPEASAERIYRLSEGITTLVNQARDLSYGNQALAYSRLEWMKALQGFIVQTISLDSDYRPAGASPGARESVALGLDCRA